MKISIVTVTRGDSAAILRRNLAGVASQTFGDIEHILVDGNDDESVCRDLACEFPAVRLLRRPARGVYDAINGGIEASTGDVIGLIHGNDRPASSHSLAEVAACFEEDEDLDFVYGDVSIVSAGADGSEHLSRYYSGADFSESRMAAGCAPPHPSLFLRSEAVRRLGPFRTDMLICSDFDMFLRILRSGMRGRYLPGVRVVMTAGGISSTIANRLAVSLREKRRALRLNGVRSSMLRLVLGLRYKI